MKLAKFTVEFLGHVLASGTNPRGQRDRFQHAGDGAIVFQQSWWHSAFAAALPDTGLRHIKPNMIHMDLRVYAETELFRRRYKRDRTRVHEAIMPGTVVEFRALVDDSITESNLETLLDRVGRFIGISPYGHKLGFGQFRLVDLEVQPSKAADFLHEGDDEDGRTTESWQPGGEVQ